MPFKFNPFTLKFDMVDIFDISTVLPFDHTDAGEITNVGSNTHVQIDSHISDSTIHFTEGSIDHGNLDGPSLLDDDHTQYLLADGSRELTADWDVGNARKIEVDHLTESTALAGVTVGDGGAGDSVIEYHVNDALAFMTGVDDSDSDAFKVSGASGFGSEDYIKIIPGSPMLIDSAAGGAADLQVNCGTDQTLELQETVWDDLRAPASSLFLLGVGADPAWGAFLGAGNLQVLRFNGVATLERVFVLFQMPHGWKEGTDIYPHVHWTPTDANAGDVKWFLEYSWQDVNGTFGASTTINVVDSTNSTAWEHLVAEFPAISGTGLGLSSMLVCRLHRDPTDGQDTYGFDAGLLELDIHYEVDTMGSRQPFVK